MMKIVSVRWSYRISKWKTITKRSHQQFIRCMQKVLVFNISLLYCICMPIYNLIVQYIFQTTSADPNSFFISLLLFLPLSNKCLLKGLCHEMNIFLYFLTIFYTLINRYFLLLGWWKNQTHSFSLLLWFCKIILEAACEKLILAHFPCSLWEVGTWEHRQITEKGIQ